MEIIKPINRDDWVDADPANGVAGAIPPAKAFSQTMAEMVNVIIASGQEPSGEDLHQFEKGIKQLVQLKVDEANLLAVSNTVYQRNVGDFFYTHNKLRGTKATGSLNGGFECNGDEFNATDFSGDANPYTLLVNNQLPWVSYDNYAQIVARFGNCGYFALDKENQKFKVPTITTAFLQAGTPGAFKEAGLPNITGAFASGANGGGGPGTDAFTGAFQRQGLWGSTGDRRGTGLYHADFDASRSNNIYGKSSTVQPPAVCSRIMVQLANEIDNATSVEKYLAQIKDAQKSALASIQAAISNLSATAEQALTDIDTRKNSSLTALDTAKTGALTALQKLYDESIENIQTEIADLEKYIDETVEPLYEAFDAAVEKSDENIVALTEQNTIAEQNIAALTQLNEGATTLAYTVHENATAAETAAAAATAAQTAAETAVNGFAENAAFCLEAAQAAIETAKDNAVATVNASADEIKATVEQAATTAENAQNTANSVVTQLEGFTETVNTAKTEITTLATTEKTGITTAANTAKTTAVTAIDTAKNGAVTAVQAAGEVISSYQQPIVALTATSGTIALEVNKIYSLSINGATTFSLPTPSNTGVFNQIKVMLKVTGTPTVNWGTSQFFNKATPEIEAGSYDVYFDYDNLLGAWVAGAMPKGAAS